MASQNGHRAPSPSPSGLPTRAHGEPGEVPAVLNIDAHDSVGGWLAEMRARGVSVPLEACRGLSQAMRHLELDFPATFRLFWKHGKIWLVERFLIYDLTADALWRDR